MEDPSLSITSPLKTESDRSGGKKKEQDEEEHHDMQNCSKSSPSTISSLPKNKRQKIQQHKFHDPRQFITYCLSTLYSARKLDKYGRNEDDIYAFGSYAAMEWKGMISDKILESLRQDPQLAGAEFKTKQMKTSKPLLHWCCDFGLTMELIQNICWMCPSASSTQLKERSSQLGNFPIQEEFENDCTRIEILVFLLENAKYPETTLHRFIKLILTKFDLTQALPVLERYIPNKDAQLEFTKHIQYETTCDVDIAAKLLSYLAKVHQNKYSNESVF